MIIQNKGVFEDLLSFSNLRGIHSTGVGTIRNAFGQKQPTAVEVRKCLGSSYDFYKQYQNPGIGLIDGLIGHTRHATQGSISVENAHPFELENLVGVHNGTITLSSKWELDDKGGKSSEVDSLALYKYLDKHTPQEMWSKLEGAAALVWFDKRDKSFNFLRNAERPLYFAVDKENKSFFWASESWMLNVACSRNRIEIETPKAFEINKHYKMRWEENKIKGAEEVLVPFVKKPLTYSSTFGAGKSGGNNQGWHGHKTGKPRKEVHKSKVGVQFIVEDIYNWEIEEGGFTVNGMTDKGDYIFFNVDEDDKSLFDLIQKRGNTTGYYYCHSVNGDPSSLQGYHGDWKNVTYVSLKGPNIILKNKGSWKVVREESSPVVLSDIDTSSTAPYYEPHRRMSKSLFNDLTSMYKCCNCESHHAEWKDKEKTKWVDARTYFCVNCVDLPVVQDLIQESYARNQGTK